MIMNDYLAKKGQPNFLYAINRHAKNIAPLCPAAAVCPRSGLQQFAGRAYTTMAYYDFHGFPSEMVINFRKSCKLSFLLKEMRGGEKFVPNQGFMLEQF